MTDRVDVLVVTLRNNVRVDDVEALADAIRLMSPVLSVSANIAEPFGEMAGVQRERSRWIEGMIKLSKGE